MSERRSKRLATRAKDRVASPTSVAVPRPKMASQPRKASKSPRQVLPSKRPVEPGQSPLGRPASHWESLPLPLLAQCLARLGEPRDLASASLVCKPWGEEAGTSPAWKKIWEARVGTSPIWRWACSHGGFREQLAASHAMQAGDYNIRTLPFSRRDGAVLEVLLLDGDPQRIITLQQRPFHPQAYRLSGLTLKVWDEAALRRESPLLVVHDVLKHSQTEDGLLLCWKVDENEIIRVAGQEEASASSDRDGITSVKNWASDNRIRCCLVDPRSASVREVPIESSFGNGPIPHEWMDIPGGGVASVSYQADINAVGDPTNQRIVAILFDTLTGQRILTATASLEGEAPPPPTIMGEAEPCMLLARSSCVIGEQDKKLVLATACLFDHRVYRWEIPHDWQSRYQRRVRQGGAAEAVEDAQLQLLFSCPQQEQIYDVAMSSPGSRIYVVGQESLFIFNPDGRPLCAISMAEWPGLFPNALFMQDVGAFSWPLPNTSKIAFHLDTTNAIYLVDLEARPRIQWPPGPANSVGEGWGYATAVFAADSPEEMGSELHDPDGLMSWAPTGPPEWRNLKHRLYKVAGHLHMKPKPVQNPGHGRGQRSLHDPTIVEYTHCGRVMVTVADTTLPGTQRSLSAQPQTPSEGWDWGRQHTAPVVPGKAARHYQRCLMLINTETGRAFRSIPLRNSVVEAVHSAGSTIAVAVARGDTYHTTEGALLLVNFGRRQQPDAASKGKMAQPAGAARAQGRAGGRRRRRR
eukprot:jgi/Tetstr1/459063/TSEL_000399.t1